MKDTNWQKGSFSLFKISSAYKNHTFVTLNDW